MDGPSRNAAFELLVTGDFMGADEARETGLVNRFVDAEQLDAEVERLVSRIAAASKSMAAPWPARGWTGTLWKVCRPSSRSGRPDGRPDAARAAALLQPVPTPRRQRAAPWNLA
jgi:enoyl-CoA hydratase/carnithine racemase